MASRYWVGGTGNWDASTTTNWSATSGGLGGASVPTTSDDVTFDSLSNTTAYTVTVTATANCANLTMGAPLTGKITFAGTSSLLIFGNLNLSGGTAGITLTYTGTMSFNATSGTKTITSNGMTFANNMGMVFNGVGGTFQLVDAFNPGFNIQFSNGTFDANGQTTTFTGSTSVSITGSQTPTFYNLTYAPASPSKTNRITLTSNIIVSNLFTVNEGATVTNRCLISSNTLGTPVTITSASNSFNNLDLQDITGAGAGSWNLASITGNSGDCGGNSGITFTTPVTRYWIGHTGNWSSTGSWATSTGGSSGASVPLCHDTVIFDSNSFSAGSQTATCDMPRLGTGIDFTGISHNPTISVGSVDNYIFGSLTLASGMSFSGNKNLYFQSRTNCSITTNGVSLTSFVLVVNTFGATLTLADNFNGVNIDLESGTLTASGNVTISGFSQANTNTRALNMGNGTWELTGTGNVWSNSFLTNFTFNAGNSTIKISDANPTLKRITGGGFTYNNLWFTGIGTGDFQIFGSNTFNDIKDDDSSPHSLVFQAGEITTVATFTVSGNGAGNEISVNSSSTATHTLVKIGGGRISCDYLNIQHSIALPGRTWFAGTHSVNNQATATAGSGWTFTALPTIPSFLSFM